MYREACKKAENVKRAYKKEQITHFIGPKMKKKIGKKTCQNENCILFSKKIHIK